MNVEGEIEPYSGHKATLRFMLLCQLLGLGLYGRQFTQVLAAQACLSLTKLSL